MKARILDAEALKAISPGALAAYARGEGWGKTETYGTHADVYTGVQKPEIILPRTDRLADYAAVVSRLIDVFSKVNERDELSTYRDLVGADHDVVRDRRAPGEGRTLKLLTPRQAAEYAGVSLSTVRRWIKSKALKIYRAGRQLRIDESDLIACLSADKSV
jgi:excisionase family DNA binding protein